MIVSVLDVEERVGIVGDRFGGAFVLLLCLLLCVNAVRFGSFGFVMTGALFFLIGTSRLLPVGAKL